MDCVCVAVLHFSTVNRSNDGGKSKDFFLFRLKHGLDLVLRDNHKITGTRSIFSAIHRIFRVEHKGLINL